MRQNTSSTSILATVLASLFGIGNASAHFKKASTHVNMYLDPPVLRGCGPVMSICQRSMMFPTKEIRLWKMSSMIATASYALTTISGDVSPPSQTKTSSLDLVERRTKGTMSACYSFLASSDKFSFLHGRHDQLEC